MCKIAKVDKIVKVVIAKNAKFRELKGQVEVVRQLVSFGGKFQERNV